MSGSFDDLLVELQGTGWYQKRITYLLLGPIFFFMPFAFLNQVFVLHIPDHWCHPPPGLEPETLNITLDEWKATFLPVVVGPDMRPRPSQCTMYAVTNDTVDEFMTGELPGNNTEYPQVTCEQLEGYDYQFKEMKNTAVSDNDWVCTKMKRATDLFTIGVVGLIVGTAVFSAIADWKGRKPSFFFSTIFMIIFCISSIFVSHNYAAYVVIKILSFFAMMPLFQSPLNITTEISTIKTRGFVIGWACITWSIGNCVLPFIAWLCNRWKLLRVICTIPMAFVFFCWNIIPESPRWLISKGRTTEATAIMEKIAITNKAPVPDDLEKRIDAMANETQEKTYGYLSLFSSWTLALRTIYITIAFTASGFVYYQLVINIGNMAGNMFLNLFLLGLVEGPGCALGVIAADKFGRRWTHCIMLLTNSLLFFVLMWIVYNPSLNWLVIVLCMWIKLNISGTFVVAYVQAMEVFPTCVRQSGIGFATLISQTICIGGPYVIYLGATDLKLPYAIMFLVCFVGCIATFLLPETLGRSLPETLEDASNFGKGDKLCGYIKPQPNKEVESAAKRLSKISESSETSSLMDWNSLMSEVFGTKRPPKSVDPTLVRDLLSNYLDKTGESKI